MSSPGETFVVELGRASSRASRFLRGMQRADQDDVLAAAVLWCWENRDAFTEQLTNTDALSLEVWFARAVRAAKRAWRTGEVRNATESMADIPVPDDTEARAAVESAARELVRTITPEQRRIAIMQARGYSAREISEKLNVDIERVRSTRSTLRKLQELLPGTYEVTRVLRAEIAPPSDQPAVKTKTDIDTELEQLGRPQLGSAATYADDYVPHKRQYAAWEDVRGEKRLYRGRGAVVIDYEEDGPARRYLLDFCVGAPPMWVTSQLPESALCQP